MDLKHITELSRNLLDPIQSGLKIGYHTCCLWKRYSNLPEHLLSLQLSYCLTCQLHLILPTTPPFPPLSLASLTALGLKLTDLGVHSRCHCLVSFQPFLTKPGNLLLVEATVICRINYCNACLKGVPALVVKPPLVACLVFIQIMQSPHHPTGD